MSRKLASASWSLLALASIGGAAQGHPVIFHAKGPPTTTTTIIIIIIIVIVIIIVIIIVIVLSIVLVLVIIIIIIVIQLHFIIIGNYCHYHES